MGLNNAIALTANEMDKSVNEMDSVWGVIYDLGKLFEAFV
jgi:hypothetical protein